MPRRKKPARLWHREDEDVWVILHNGKQERTGYRLEQRDEAEEALREYLNDKSKTFQRDVDPSTVKLGIILDAYADAKGPKQKAPERTGYAIEALAPFWGDLTPNDVTIANCTEYERQRGVSPSTIRRELGVLNTALNHATKAMGLINTPRAELPEKPEPLDRWLTQEEVSALRRHVPPHIDRFIVLSLFTGRRKKAVLDLRWKRSPHHGWIDMDKQMIHFKGYADTESSKRKGSISMPANLVKIAETWQEDCNESVIHYKGKPVSDVSTGFNNACKLAGLEDVVRHTLKHTAVTWAFQEGMMVEDAVEYFATSAETLLKVYKQHSPLHQHRAVAVMNQIGNDIVADNVATEENLDLQQC